MLVSFSVANYRSFLGEETISLVASNRIGSHEDHLVDIPNTSAKVLKTAVLYGANGAGKSNLFKALKYLQKIALRQRKKNTGTGREAFRFGGEADSPSSFDVQFISENKLYRFGIKVNDHSVTEEWLLLITGGKERILYERVTDEHSKVTIDISGISKEASEKLKAQSIVGSPPNQSFLATITANLEEEDVTADLLAVLDWFSNSLVLISPNSSYGPLGSELSDDPGFRDFVSDFLKSSSTGVDHIVVNKTLVKEEEIKNVVPKAIAPRVIDDLKEMESGGSVKIELPNDGSVLIIERSEDNSYYQITIQAAHLNQKGEMVSLELRDESDGTRRLLDLLPALYRLKSNNAVFFIDEIDRSMHPILVKEYLDFFIKLCTNGHRQMIVTTHESNLLDLDLVRRDEIWFSEKDSVGATRLYSLADFKVRKDLEIRKHYLQGRFGAVPFLGNLDLLISKENCAE